MISKLSTHWILRTIFFSLALVASGCTKKAELGTKDNPIHMFFVPNADADRIFAESEELAAFLEKETGLVVKTGVPASYIAVVEAFGTGKTDVAILNTFGYLLANEKYGAEARLRVLRYGRDYYQGQILTRAEDNISDIKSLQGKSFAYTDPSSTSGFIFPSKMIKDAGVTLGSTVFANKHDNVVTMLYQKQVDAGATFYSPPENGEIKDARSLVKTQYPDVEQKIKVLALSDHIPNDPVTFRKGLKEEIKVKLSNALLKYSLDKEGNKVLTSLYNITGLVQASDADYKGFRDTVKAMGTDVSTLVK